ncbi:hypothetical protein OROGR_018102 [Orobanche gracilis]
MAFHMALFSNPQHAAVVLTFASLLYHQTWEESIKFARRSALDTWNYTPEILDASHNLSDDEIAERVTQFAGQVKHSVDVLIDKDCLLEAMNRFPEIPCSGLVFVSQRLGQQVKDIVNIRTKDITSLEPDKRIADIDYRLLTQGNRGQVRFVLGKIILHTLSYRPMVTKAKKDITQVKESPEELEVLEPIRAEPIDGMVKNADKRSISPSNNDPSSPQISRKLGPDEFDFHSYGLVLNKNLKDKPVKVEINRKVPLLSSLF